MSAFSRPILLLCISAIGGFALHWAGFPAGWLTGAMIAVALLGFAGVRGTLPKPLVQANLLCFGISIGSGVTPQAMASLPALWPSIIVLTLSLTTSVYLCSFWLQSRHKWPAAEARFASIPGALPSVLLLAEAQGARMDYVAIAQLIRQGVLVIGLPLLLANAQTDSPAIAATTAGGFDLGIQLAFGAVFGFLLEKLRFPGGLMLGAMCASAALHLAGWVEGAVPIWLIFAIYTTTGVIIGGRLGGLDPRKSLALFRPSFEGVMVSTFVAASFAWAAHHFLPVSFAGLLLAYAPGGVETMIAISVALQLDALAVGLHHFLRLFILNVMAPIWMPKPSPEAKIGQ